MMSNVRRHRCLLHLRRFVESIHRCQWPLAYWRRQPPFQLLVTVLPQRVQLHQASDQSLVKEDLQHRHAPRSLS